MSTHPLDPLLPSCDELLQIVFAQVDHSMLREIAAADYGQDADEHLEQLALIKSGTVLAPMQWEPQEVLELIRWSEPEDPTWSPGSSGERGHWMRLFACSALLRAATEPANEGHFTGEASTIIQLVDSAIELGEKTSVAAMKFLCWCVRTRSLGDWDRPYFALAILILLVRLDQSFREALDFLDSASRSDELKRSELLGDCQKSKTWRKLVREVLIKSTNSNQKIQEIGNSLL